MTLSGQRAWPLHWLAVLPVLVAVCYFHRDAPYHDQWDLLPLIDAYYRGQLDINQLTASHNGHILFLPRLIMLGLAITTHWNTFAEVLCSLVLGILNFSLFLLLARHCAGGTLSRPAGIAVSILAFSLAQAENWLWGWQLQVPLCLSAVLTGFVALRFIATPWLAVGLGALCGVAACFSFAAGLVFWFAAIPLVLDRQRLLLLPWMVASALCIGLYLHLLGDTAPVPHNDSDPGVVFYGNIILGILANTLTCLGSVAARFDTLAALLIALLGLGWMAALLRTTPVPQRAPLLALALFGIGSALLIALSRSGMGTEQMLSSRYTTLCLPFWVSLVLLLEQVEQQSTRRYPLNKPVGMALLVLIVCTSVFSLKDFQRLHKRFERAELALSQPASVDGQKALAIINPRQDQARAQAEVALLAQYQLSFYRR